MKKLVQGIHVINNSKHCSDFLGHLQSSPIGENHPEDGGSGGEPRNLAVIPSFPAFSLGGPNGIKTQDNQK